MNNSSKGLPRDLNFKSVEELEGSPWQAELEGRAACVANIVGCSLHFLGSRGVCSAKQITAICTFIESLKIPPEENKCLA